MNSRTTCTDFCFLMGAFDGRYHLDESHWTGTGRGPFTIAPLRAPQWSKGKPGEWKWCVVMGLVVLGFQFHPYSPPKTKTIVNFRIGISQCWGLSPTSILGLWSQSVLRRSESGCPQIPFLLAAVLGVLDGFFAQALLDEFIFCKIRRGINNKPVLVLSSPEKVLKLKNCH